MVANDGGNSVGTARETSGATEGEETAEARQDEESTTSPGVTADVVFQTLSNERRRLALQALASEGTMTVRELTTSVAAAENGVAVEELEYRERKRVYTSLVQTHLPAMHKNDVVDYDKSRGVVTLRPETREFEAYIASDRGDRFTRLLRACLGLSGLSLVASLFAWLGVGPFHGFPAYGYALVFGVALAGLVASDAIVERYDDDLDDLFDVLD
jgi:hypothetical protein